jgi:PleD family two-component response regulator
MGAAAYNEGMNVDKLLQMADERLYIAKDSGRNKVVS